ncbi:uncharacterized protein LOC115929231 [Strongylocentrotus purpuratus]|uniref:Uncharacterized protein n=1 Tax=Strongylocentrotus purpuratus TaxID=7668 RepID=A0A7M7PLX8_STRPU|nr:uncharacterized protein LOC115929231 [Strongylocentrotus purpuratus]
MEKLLETIGMETLQEAGGCSSTSIESMVGRKGTRKRKKITRADRETDTSPQPKPKKVKNATGKPFCCDSCGSRFVVNPLRRKPGQSSKGKATPRYVVDQESQKLLTLCNACGIKMERKSRAPPRDPPPSVEDKQRYYESAQHFAASLVEGLGEPDAEKLTCPVYNTKPCGCIQKFIIGEGDREESKKRAIQLLSILKDAKRLREKKFYNREEVLSKGKGQRKVGLGNGHRKAKEYEDFVLANRKILRGDLRMCERATQRILLYSNNFLHKRLKTDPQNRTQRLQRTKGQAALGKLVDVEKLSEQTCCLEKCVLLARTHSLLLNQWRDRAISGQTEARKVLAEMLTPSGQGSNCARFIAMVTGSSITTIARVKDQMCKTGGDREPPQHGLKKYWKNHPRSKTLGLLGEDGEVLQGSRAGSAEAGAGQAGAQGSLMTVAQLIEQQDQLKRLQQQLEEQQQQVRQQQRLVEQQLIQHQLRQNRQLKQQAALAEAQRKVTRQIRAGNLPGSSKSSTSNTATAHPTAQNMSTNRGTNPSTLTMQPLTADQQGRIYVQSPVSTNQPAQSTATQSQPSNQHVPTIVGMTIEQQQQQLQQQHPLTATVAGLEGIDAKLLQQNLQQILVELQNQMVTQQIQQQLINFGMQPGPSGGSSQPPSYSTAVAATNNSQVLQTSPPQQPPPQQPQQQQKTQKDGSQQTQIIIQTIPSLQPNLLLSSNGHGIPGSSNMPHYVNTSASGSMARLKAADSSHVMVPITLHHPGGPIAGGDAVNVEEVNVQLQEVVMPLSTQDSEACNLVLPRQQQLPTILQGTIQQHLSSLGHLASHSSDSGTTRPTTTISIESLCGNQQTSPGNMGDIVVTEVDDGTRMMQGSGEESIPSAIPLVGGVSVETLLSPEALHLLNSTGQASLNVSLSSARTVKPNTPGAGAL